MQKPTGYVRWALFFHGNGSGSQPMNSTTARRRRLETPHLHIAYSSRDYRALREQGESWKILTEDAKETEGFAERPLRR